MAATKNQKLKLLYILKFLQENTELILDMI